MQPLKIERPVPFILPPDVPISVCLIGCGGTGSHIAQCLARLAVHALGRTPLSLTFVDGDTVEPKNVGRQLFGVADIGLNKAQALAARFSAVFGLRINAVPVMATSQIVAQSRLGDAIGILVGAVDGASGRQALHAGLESGTWRLWLDSGNHESAGQVVAGTATEPRQLQGALALGSICGALPAPSLVYPDLIQDAPATPRTDCATAMEDNLQSLIVNQMMAAIAGEYLYQLIIKRRITTFQTTVDLATLTMRSVPITATNLAEAAKISAKTLTSNKKASAA